MYSPSSTIWNGWPGCFTRCGDCCRQFGKCLLAPGHMDAGLRPDRRPQLPHSIAHENLAVGRPQSTQQILNPFRHVRFDSNHAKTLPGRIAKHRRGHDSFRSQRLTGPWFTCQLYITRFQGRHFLHQAVRFRRVQAALWHDANQRRVRWITLHPHDICCPLAPFRFERNRQVIGIRTQHASKNRSQPCPLGFLLVRCSHCARIRDYRDGWQ